MTVYKRGRIYWYDFWYLGQRHNDTTRQTDKELANAVEADIKRDLRHRAAGLVVPGTTSRTPRFQDWANVVLAARRKEITDPKTLEETLRVALCFFGRRPTDPDKVDATAPYHDLCLADPITEPAWLDRFESWMTSRGVAGSTRNHYRSAISVCYRVALRAKFRSRTGVMLNPMRDLPRDPPEGRDVALTVKQLRAWLTHAPAYARHAVGIGALAPKLRMASILALEWDVHLDPQLQWLTVRKHKTARRSGKPQVLPISKQLQRILRAIRRAQPLGSTHVIVYRGKAIKSMRGALQRAAEAAGLPWGLKVENGVTFHVLRHTAATLMAEKGMPEARRQQVMGHSSIQTTQGYTHLRPVHLRPDVESLSRAVPIEDLVVGTIVGTRASGGKKTQGKHAKAADSRKVRHAG